jgi:hypothetical protein
MKVARNVFFGLAVLGIGVFMSGVSFAQEAPAAVKDPSAMEAKRVARIKLLQDSAAALQAANSDLAMQLTDIVDEQSKENTEENREKLAKTSLEELKTKYEARVKLFKDAAAALQATNPDLAEGLKEMAAPKHRPGMQRIMQEKTEPTPEQGETK